MCPDYPEDLTEKERRLAEEHRKQALFEEWLREGVRGESFLAFQERLRTEAPPPEPVAEADSPDDDEPFFPDEHELTGAEPDPPPEKPAKDEPWLDREHGRKDVHG